MSRVDRLTRTMLAAGLATIGLCGAAAAVSDPVGVWTLSTPGTARQCRLQLRADPSATGQAIAMPPGCRRAFPILAAVRSWSVPDGAHLALNDEVGANVLMFAETGDGRLAAARETSEAAFVLTALGPRRDAAAAASPNAAQEELTTPTLPAASAPPAAVAAPLRAPPTVAGISGHYAVMRGSRDTGCMVTLEDAGRAAATLKARLAPACRDQGIIVFDPVGWSLKAGHLVLAARRGHTAIFSEDEAGTWVKDPETGQPLGLKRL